MANTEHLEILKQGAEVWNEFRKDRPRNIFDLSGAYLQNSHLSFANLSFADLRFVHLEKANLQNANLSFANLSNANLHHSNLTNTVLDYASLCNANLRFTTLQGADFTGADVSGLDLSEATIGWTSFDNINLSLIKGLDTVRHLAPSTIGIDTLFRSGGSIPEVFLRGCGVPDELIAYMHSLTAAGQPIQFSSCFISYSHKDEEFARRLYSRMREANLRVWYAPEEMKGGQKLHEQIFNAIHVHDKLLLVLSEHSLKSEWVMSEIHRARKVEREENRRKLFPIRLVDFEAILKWECFDADSGKDLAVEMREYFIPDFSNWKDHDSFEKAFERLLRDLKAKEDKNSKSDAASTAQFKRAVLSPRNTFRDEWEQVESSIIKIAKRNELINEDNIEASQVINKLFEMGIISEAIREQFYSLKKWHHNVVFFGSSSSVEPQSAITFVNMAEDLQSGVELACVNNRNNAQD